MSAPYWAIPRPYQPASKHWTPQVVGATNPIWIDGDGDRKFTPAKIYAAKLVERNLSNPKHLLSDLGTFDQAVCAQAAGLWQKSGKDVRDPELQRLLKKAPENVQNGFSAYIRTLP